MRSLEIANLIRIIDGTVTYSSIDHASTVLYL
jgi:hypothetical protein